jgi:hypothetical protein
MKKILCVLVVSFCSLCALFSCSDDTNPAQQYGNTLMQSKKSAQKLDAKVNVIQVQKSIQEYYAANGRYPADLDELSTFNGMTLKSDHYDYDPATGSLTKKR